MNGYGFHNVFLKYESMNTTKMVDMQSIIGIMGNVVDIIRVNIIPISGSLVTGMLGTWLFFRPKIGKRNEYIEELEKSTKKQAKQLKNQGESLEHHETSLTSLNQELSERENVINDAREKISELNDRAKEIIFAKDRHIETLNNALETKEQDIKKLTKRAQEIETKENKGTLELKKQVKTIADLQSQLIERSDQIASLKEERADSENRMQKSISERDSHIDKLSDSVEANNEKISMLTERLQEKDEVIQSYQDQISKMEESIHERAREQGLQIKNLSDERSDLLEQIQKIMTRAEEAESREIEMGNALKTKDLEYASLHQRTRRMHDDFTHLAGIGKKISTTLNNAGIKTFSKLADTDVNHIREVLEKENPALLKLSNPATWPEQARIAAEGDWEALSNLQKSIKATKS
jgi:predicted flap endonuclease-1-like 5' DNA nuclease